MNIRKLKREDLSGLITLYGHLHENDISAGVESSGDVWDQTEHCGIVNYFGLFLNLQLVSCCQLVVVPNFTRGNKPYGLVENVVTHSGYRGNGYGKAVLKFALDQAWTMGCYKVMLMTGRNDERVFNFYRSAGFKSGEKQAFIAKPSST